MCGWMRWYLTPLVWECPTFNVKYGAIFWSNVHCAYLLPYTFNVKYFGQLCMSISLLYLTLHVKYWAKFWWNVHCALLQNHHPISFCLTIGTKSTKFPHCSIIYIYTIPWAWIKYILKLHLSFTRDGLLLQLIVSSWLLNKFIEKNTMFSWFVLFLLKKKPKFPYVLPHIDLLFVHIERSLL
jgi:hypothetical protein